LLFNSRTRPTHAFNPPTHTPPPSRTNAPPHAGRSSVPSGLSPAVKIGRYVTIEPNCALRSCRIGNFVKVRCVCARARVCVCVCVARDATLRCDAHTLLCRCC
jgi:hypothetical protein